MNPTTLLLDAAAQAAGAQHYPAPALYVVATPIGNRADLSLRALHVLNLVDAVACEDTHNSGRLLQGLGLHKPLLAVHEHNERQAATEVLARLAQGQRVAYMSDAGTPAVSDPGAALVRAVRSAGHACVPVPGASSAVAALSVAGDAAAQGFVFRGFLPARGRERAAALQALAQSAACTVLFEAPHRIEELAAELARHLGGREVTLARELTKQFEQLHTAAAQDLPAWLAEDPQHRRGEFVVVVHAAPAAAPAADADDAPLPPAAEHALQVLLQALPTGQAASLAAEISGVPRKRLYARAISLKQGEDEGADPSGG